MKKLSFFVCTLLLSTFAGAETLSFQEEVRVITSKPEYRMVTTRTPFQECWDEQVEVRYQPQPQSNNDGKRHCSVHLLVVLLEEYWDIK